MLKFICLLALAYSAAAASIGGMDSIAEKREVIPVLKFETNKHPDGSFSFMYEGGDKSFREESGVLQNAGTEDEALEVSGSYRYIDADGREIEVHYTAGKNGFVPVGTNILSEISALAKAAATLPDQEPEEGIRRKARSKSHTTEEENIPVKIVPVKAAVVAEAPAKVVVPVSAPAEKLIVKEEKPVKAEVAVDPVPVAVTVAKDVPETPAKKEEKEAVKSVEKTTKPETATA